MSDEASTPERAAGRFRAVFFGTPQFAVPCLEALVEIADVVGVVCQPDRPQGRGLELTAPPVKKRALELGPERGAADEAEDGRVRGLAPRAEGRRRARRRLRTDPAARTCSTRRGSAA